jgi:hypothetical protein
VPKIPLLEKPTIAFDYIKTSGFQSLHVDGAIGGMTPRGDVNVAFFAERAALPRRLVHELNDDGTLGEIKDMESRNSVVREMSVGVVMSAQVAEELHKWLGDQIALIKTRKGEEE